MKFRRDKCGIFVLQILKLITDWSANHTKMRSLATSTPESNSAPQFETLEVTIPKPFVYHVILNRPTKRNAMCHNMWL